MENIWGMILNAENGRMLALAILGYFGYMRLITQIKEGDNTLEKRLGEKISELERSIDKKLLAFHAMLKANDFAHLNHTIEALTFTIDSRLDG